MRAIFVSSRPQTQFVFRFESFRVPAEGGDVDDF